MAKAYYDSNANLALIQQKRVAVIGYGSQGHAHALKMKESGCEVVVGLPFVDLVSASHPSSAIETQRS